MSFIPSYLISRIGELTSAAELFREQSGFYEKPQYSRRLVKRLVGPLQ
jgi:predicted transcriptional regulator